MRAASFDRTKLDQTIEVLDSLHRHRLESPTDKSDEMYYELMARYFRSLRDAKERGKLLIHTQGHFPVEIFHAMDMVPVVMEMYVAVLANLCNLFESGLSTSKAYGLPSECCGTSRYAVGYALSGWTPIPDALVWTNSPCDEEAKSLDITGRLYDRPYYFVERGYDYTEREVIHYQRELEAAVAFLERLSGRKMDWDRLSEAVSYSRQMMELQREIEILRTARPSPIRSRSVVCVDIVDFVYRGKPEGPLFNATILNEAKARVQAGVGAVKEEKYRLVQFMVPPIHSWKLLDWMERAHGAMVVSSPISTHWGEGDYDPGKPLEALARQAFIMHPGRQCNGPVEPMVEDFVDAAKKSDVDGVLAFAFVTCRESPSCIRLIKDRVMEETGLPTYSVECDCFDPAFVSEDDMRDKIEGFFEMIDARRG